MAYKIAKNIPIPPRTARTAATKAREFDWERLEVGDSLFVSATGKDEITSKHCLMSASGSAFKKKHATEGWNYTTRRVTKGIRAWRVA